jgi:hypothetical protein
MSRDFPIIYIHDVEQPCFMNYKNCVWNPSNKTPHKKWKEKPGEPKEFYNIVAYRPVAVR